MDVHQVLLYSEYILREMNFIFSLCFDSLQSRAIEMDASKILRKNNLKNERDDFLTVAEFPKSTNFLTTVWTVVPIDQFKGISAGVNVEFFGGTTVPQPCN